MKQFVSIVLVVMISALSFGAQTVNPAKPLTTHFAKDGVEFDYPAEWKVNNAGSGQSRYTEFNNETKTVQLVIYWEFGAVLDCDFEKVRRRINQGLVDGVAKQLNTANPPDTSWTSIHFGDLYAEQKQLRGLIASTPVIADVYAFGIPHIFINLIYLRPENDETAKAAWEMIRSTLQVGAPEPTANGTKPAGPGSPIVTGGGVLNGRAIHLAKPEYPAKAKGSHASGAVTVQVLIDENGNVIAACSISGHPLLRESAERAARQAKFTPTILKGTPVRIIGTIVYNFVAFP